MFRKLTKGTTSFHNSKEKLTKTLTFEYAPVSVQGAPGLVPPVRPSTEFLAQKGNGVWVGIKRHRSQYFYKLGPCVYFKIRNGLKIFFNNSKNFGMNSLLLFWRETLRV